MSSISTQVFVGTIAGEIVLFTAGLGWIGRTIVASYRSLAAKVATLTVAQAIADSDSPELKTAIMTNTALLKNHGERLAVVEARGVDHERWHERHPIIGT